ncbi:MAG: hypothetical protein D9V47_02125 [Clostridia bacterium]|nr:MAG: hypothetical protein D9V47_02125 [Clostridia bacterium]
MTLTERDIQVLSFFAKYRFCTRGQLVEAGFFPKRGLKDGGYGALELVLRCFIEVVEKGNPKLPDYSFEYIWSTLPKSLS